MKNLVFVLLMFPLIVWGQDKNYKVNEHMIGYFPFDGNANDVSENNNHGQIFGAKFTKDRFGRDNSAIEFDGVDDYILINGSKYNFSMYDDFAIALWVKPAKEQVRVITKDNRTNIIANDILSKWGSVNSQYQKFGYPFTIRLYNQTSTQSNTILFAQFDGYKDDCYYLREKEVKADEEFNFKECKVSSDKFYNVVCQKEGDSLSVFINGVLTEKGKSNLYCETKNPAPLLIGSRTPKGKSDNYSSDFKGVIDDLKIFNRSLTLEEIKNINNQSPENKNVFKKRKLVLNKEDIVVQSKKVTIKLWDNAQEDGDIVSIFIDNEETCIIPKFKVKKQESEFTIELEKEESLLIFFAENEGENPPNTAALSIDDGVRVQQVILSADKQTSEALRIFVKE